MEDTDSDYEFTERAVPFVVVNNETKGKVP